MSHDSDSPDPIPLDADPWQQPVRATYSDDGSPSQAIVELIAEMTDRDPREVPPLNDSVDTDAMEALIDGSVKSNGRAEVSFTHAGVHVSIRCNGSIEARIDAENCHAESARPGTDSELNGLLRRLLNEATRNGISVDGGWTIRNGPELPDWEVHITQVIKPDGVASGNRG